MPNRLDILLVELYKARDLDHKHPHSPDRYISRYLKTTLFFLGKEEGK